MNTAIPIPKKVTAAWLRGIGACEEAVSSFAGLFPDGASPTAKTLANSSYFDVDWLAGKLLTAPAHKAYREAGDAAHKAFMEAIAPAHKAHVESLATAYTAHNAQEAIATANRAYVDARNTEYKAYEEAIAAALIKIAFGKPIGGKRRKAGAK